MQLCVVDPPASHRCAPVVCSIRRSVVRCALTRKARVQFLEGVSGEGSSSPRSICKEHAKTRRTSRRSLNLLFACSSQAAKTETPRLLLSYRFASRRPFAIAYISENGASCTTVSPARVKGRRKVVGSWKEGRKRGSLATSHGSECGNQLRELLVDLCPTVS